MDLNLKGKSVVVTAASKGLGRAIAHTFAKEGANVLISSRSEEKLRQTANEIKQETGNEQVDYAVCDMKDPQQIKHLIGQAAEWKGSVDVLINNAGGPPAGPFMEMTDEDWYEAFEMNLLSFARTIREVVPWMKQQGEGRIVNIASSSVEESLDNLVLSNTMRPGIVGLSKTLARELGEQQILINTIGPGTIETDRIANLNQVEAENQGITEEEVKQEAIQGIPMKLYGDPEEFANLAVFLASGANTYITGQTILVEGGKVKAL